MNNQRPVYKGKRYTLAESIYIDQLVADGQPPRVIANKLAPGRICTPKEVSNFLHHKSKVLNEAAITLTDAELDALTTSTTEIEWLGKYTFLLEDQQGYSAILRKDLWTHKDKVIAINKESKLVIAAPPVIQTQMHLPVTKTVPMTPSEKSVEELLTLVNNQMVVSILVQQDILTSNKQIIKSIENLYTLFETRMKTPLSKLNTDEERVLPKGSHFNGQLVPARETGISIS